MKRTIALLLGLLLLITCVPVAARAETDVKPRLEVTLNPTAKTLFQYGTDLYFNWTNADLTVKLYDLTAENVDGTTLTLANAISAGKYVIMIGTTTYNPAVGSQYAFAMGDLGSKTITLKYTYKPTGFTNSITVTKDLTISVQQNILTDLTVTGPTQKTYYAGEYLNLGGLVAKGTYSNMTDPVTLDNAKLTVTASDTDGTSDLIAVTDPLTVDQKQINVTYSETYPGSETIVSFTKTVSITVNAAPAGLALDLAEIPMTLGVTAPVTLTASVTSGDVSGLVATIDNPAVAAINVSTLLTNGEIVVTALSAGTANITVRTRGSNESVDVPVIVEKAPIPALAVTLDKATLSLPVNSSFALTATVSPDDTTDKTLTWTSSNPANVSVDSTGTVKVLRDYSNETIVAGSGITLAADGITRVVTITVETVNGKKAECLVSVNAIPVDGIAISDTNVTLYKKSYKQLSAVVTPYNAANPSITWTTNNPDVATVDSNGKVTAVGIPTGATYGEAVITAQTSNSAVFATCTIKVLPSTLCTSITLNKSTLALNVGDEETLSTTVLPSAATNKTLVWTSDNTDVATVNSSGKIIANSKGTAVIKAAATDGSGLSASCTVTVSNIQVLNISLDKTSLDLSEGDTASIKATIYPTNATNPTIKWTSSNTNVATVDSKGNIVAGSMQGYSIIRASATDGSGRSAECVVLSKPKIYVTGLTLNYGTTLDLLVNDSTYLKATIIPANASSTTVTWTSSNTAVATIDSNGLLKGVAVGQATITATVDGKSVTMKVTVTNTEYNYGVAANFKRRVNVRATASGLGKLVGYAYIGDTFHILGKTGSWYQIQYNNTTKGYIWASYLNATKTSSGYTSAGKGTSAGTTAAPGTTTTPKTVTITNCLYAVNVRTSASTTSTRIGKAPLGATYTYLGTEGDWYKIQFNTTTVGYVYNTFGALS